MFENANHGRFGLVDNGKRAPRTPHHHIAQHKRSQYLPTPGNTTKAWTVAEFQGRSSPTITKFKHARLPRGSCTQKTRNWSACHAPLSKYFFEIEKTLLFRRTPQSRHNRKKQIGSLDAKVNMQSAEILHKTSNVHIVGTSNRTCQ